jgi:hypothetical protein
MRAMRGQLLSFFSLLIAFSGCVSAPETIPNAWRSVPEAPRMRSLQIDLEGKLTHSPVKPPRKTVDGPVSLADEFVGPKVVNGPKALTEPFLAIESFAYSEKRGEVAFSAKREKDFDIGLVSSDGSPIKWVPNDPADEIGVQWAPRGSRISFILRAFGGDVVRVVRILTGTEASVPFENATVHALAWDAAGERYAVSYSTPDASDRVEILNYSGEDRKTAVPPAVQLDVSLEPFAPGAVILRPNDIRYDEKLPLVVWSAPDFQWSDARAALMNAARVAMVISTREPSDELWRAANATPWIDTKRAFVVGARCTCDATVIVTDPAMSPAHYRRADRIVTVAPAVVQSFAAGFIADQLKRTLATNGSSR